MVDSVRNNSQKHQADEYSNFVQPGRRVVKGSQPTSVYSQVANNLHATSGFAKQRN